MYNDLGDLYQSRDAAKAARKPFACILKRLTILFLNLVQSYLSVIVLALVFALVWPSKAVLLAPSATLFLQIIFFLTSLKLDATSILKEVSDIKLLAVSTFFMLIALPAVTLAAVLVIFPWSLLLLAYKYALSRLIPHISTI